MCPLPLGSVELNFGIEQHAPRWFLLAQILRARSLKIKPSRAAAAKARIAPTTHPRFSVSDTIVLDSVTHLTSAHRGLAAYCASHGGTYAGYFAAKMGIGAIILNDAGIGREQAGIVGLHLLDALGVPAAAISHASARIGCGTDGFKRGRLSFVNAAARQLGLEPGMTCARALQCMSIAKLTPSPAPAPLAEARFEIVRASNERIRVFGIDSNALVTADDVGHIAITGSHGGLLGDKAATAIKVDVACAIYNDAGFGADAAGISRLPALDARQIAGACVSCFSARIGDARSTYEDGYISALNETAAGYGGAIGQSCRAFVAAMVAQRGRAW